MAPNNFGGGVTLFFMVLPLVFIGVGVLYMALAAGDRRKRHDRSVPVLPVGAQHPLSHVRSKMKPTTQAVRQPDQKTSKRRRSEPPWLTPV